MIILFGILVIVASVVLGLIVLVQNPKGGGLSGTFGGVGNQLMGVKQTTDVLEKGTWILAVVVVLLCLFSTLFIPKATKTQVRVPTSTSAPVTPGAQPVTPQPQPTGK